MISFIIVLFAIFAFTSYTYGFSALNIFNPDSMLSKLAFLLLGGTFLTYKSWLGTFIVVLAVIALVLAVFGLRGMTGNPVLSALVLLALGAASYAYFMAR